MKAKTVRRRAAFALLLTVSFFGCGRSEEVGQLKSTTPRDRIFHFEHAEDPALRPPGPGAGRYASERPQLTMRAQKKVIQGYLDTTYAEKKHGEQAVALLDHFFDNTGSLYKTDLSQMIDEVKSVRNNFGALIMRLEDLLKQAEPGVYQFSMHQTKAGHIDRAENKQWWLAIGQYQYWLVGKAEVILSQDDRKVILFEIKQRFWDKYDMDPGVKVPVGIPGTDEVVYISQDYLGKFHRQGLGREFALRGESQLSYGKVFDLD